jgi:hypothetical protein
MYIYKSCVYFTGVVFISDSALIPFLLNKNLQDLSLAESDHITDKILIKISEHLNTSVSIISKIPKFLCPLLKSREDTKI